MNRTKIVLFCFVFAVMTWVTNTVLTMGQAGVARTATVVPVCGMQSYGNNANVMLNMDPTGLLCSSAIANIGTASFNTTGLATSALQTTANTKLDTINTSIGAISTGLATSALQTTSNTKLDTLNTSLGTINTSIGTAQPRTLSTAAGVITGTDEGGGIIAANVHIRGGTVTASFTTTGLSTSANQVLTNAALGSITDAECSTPTGNCSQIALMKKLTDLVNTPTGPQLKAGSNSITRATDEGEWSISIASGSDVALGGTNDSECGTVTGNCSLIALTKKMADVINTPTGTQAAAASNSVTQCTSCVWAVSTQPTAVTATDKSGAVTTGGTSYVVAASNASRKGLHIQNPCTATGQGVSTAESIFVRISSSAGVNDGHSDEVLPCGTWDTDDALINTAAVNITASTSSHKWVAIEVQ